jgi:DUF4097 and DUF4098 domain-containing protein YvlB
MKRCKAMVWCMAPAYGLILAGCVTTGPLVWVEQVDESTIPAGALDQLELRTHNGEIKVTGDAEREDILVTVHRKVGGRDEASALACRDAIEIRSEASGERGHSISWVWKMRKQRDWVTRVSYTVEMPARLALRAGTYNGAVNVETVDGSCDLSTHNGAVTARSVKGACQVKTHNGFVEIEAADEPVFVRSHNGPIKVATAAPSIDLWSHNGSIAVDAEASRQFGGQITSHNGLVRVTVGSEASTQITCKSHNGRIKCEAPLRDVETARRYAKGTLGKGGPALRITTFNGPIKVVQTGT